MIIHCLKCKFKYTLSNLSGNPFKKENKNAYFSLVHKFHLKA